MRGRCNFRVTLSLAALSFFSSAALGQKYAPPFPRDGAKKAQESDCFAIWDVKFENGKSTGMHELPLDQVSVFLTEGPVKFSKPDGTWSIEQERIGSVRFESKGTVEAEEGVSDQPSHAIVFQLKDVAPPKRPITEGVPDYLPRPGTAKLFETDRIIVWDQTFRPGPAPRHQHYSSTAGVFLDGGLNRTTYDPPQGMPPPATITHFPGQIVNHTSLLKGPHREEQLEGAARVIYVQLK